MPRFSSLRNVLRRSNDIAQEMDDFMSGPSSIPFTPRPEFPSIPFVSLHRRPGLISLAEAQRTPEIVYHSVSSIPEPTPEPELEFPAHSYQIKLVPLAVAAACRDIKYRREGFEMMEARAHIEAVRADLF
ncbi:uncharacterized protein PHACADRAFT_96246 [Phanerochaete carnosa HHB-10118-sp]|uniref:Uncharacterized protein n=1 Tax=Phanerochaete carnosa (strain HHB-10118-sp) TaxID=650164 RepID=K5V070_PHACS|nr:uncharacterized protein PHACADRAFT_96246 [Phanerochaete carnosa HHB-10118-sp]EKM55841.1 hypothetical protein PHACADRAFT_96246 [Phanerochaete carnosa HHB-10118-sp]